MIKKVCFALSSVALAGVALFGCLRGNLFPVNASGTVSPSYDFYFDAIRSETQSKWSRLSAVDVDGVGVSTPYMNVSFTIPAGTAFDSEKVYCFRLCSAADGNVWLYYVAAPSQGNVGYCDFTLTWSDDGTARDVYWFYQNRMRYDGSAYVSYLVSQGTASGLYANSSDINLIVGSSSSMSEQSESLSFSGLWVATYNHNNEEQAYSQGFDDGRYAGDSEGYASGVVDGRSDGFASGYSDGFVNGYGSGVNDGMALGETTMIDIWPLLGAIITMPFTFLTQEWNATLFAGTPYQFSVSMFVSSVLIILMLWKIITMVIGLTGK